ncbi:MAG: hypothetical protein J6K72_06300 [Clostridia bacterium]|nr:hypothetical protein [Clostridia bacterium]
MKTKFLVFLLAALLLILPLGALGENEVRYEIVPSSMIVFPADEGNVVYITGSLQNTSDKPLFVGYGSCDMFDKAGNLLCTTSTRCIPMLVEPGQVGVFRADVPSLMFSDPEAEVADFAFRFEPSIDEGPGYTLLSPDVSMDTSVREYDDCPITLTIHNTTGRAIEGFDVCVSLWVSAPLSPGGEQLIFMPESTLFYNRIPAGGTVDVKLYIPYSVMEALEIGWPEYAIYGLVAIPD